MNKGKIMRMALDAFGAGHEIFWMHDTDTYIEAFAELVAAAERKSCIDDCNAEAATEGTAQRIIQRICARGQE